MLVLVADQDPDYAELIGELLRRQSHRVVIADTADSFQHFVERSTANLIIVSANLVEGQAAAMVSDLCRRQSAPVIVTSENAGPLEIAGCLAAGAEDCIRKPFHPSEFAARVDAVGRRWTQTHDTESGIPVAVSAPVDATVGATVPESGIVGQGLELDEVRERALFNGKDLHCSQLEFNILKVMAGMEGQVLSHTFLNARVWGYANLSDGTLLKGHMSSIRRKLKSAGIDRPLIRTIYGVGYALAA